MPFVFSPNSPLPDADRDDAGKLIVCVPVKFSHISERKKIETSHPAEFQTDSPILRAIARGMAWLRMLDEGKVSSIYDLADTLKLERKYVRVPACAPLRGLPAAKVPYEFRSSVHSTLRLAFHAPSRVPLAPLWPLAAQARFRSGDIRVIRAIMQGQDPDGLSLAALRTPLAAALQWASPRRYSSPRPTGPSRSGYLA